MTAHERIRRGFPEHAFWLRCPRCSTYLYGQTREDRDRALNAHLARMHTEVVE